MGNLIPRRHHRVFEEFIDHMRGLENWMDSFVGGDLLTFDKGVKFPKINVRENSKEYIIEAAVPGMHKDDIRISVENNVLYLAGKMQKQSMVENEDADYVLKELSHRSFERAIPFKDKIKHNINAKLKGGMLIIKAIKEEVKSNKKENIEIIEE